MHIPKHGSSDEEQFNLGSLNWFQSPIGDLVMFVSPRTVIENWTPMKLPQYTLPSDNIQVDLVMLLGSREAPSLPSNWALARLELSCVHYGFLHD